MKPISPVGAILALALAGLLAGCHTTNGQGNHSNASSNFPTPAPPPPPPDQPPTPPH
jgi:predicted small secreted protein